MCPPKSRFAGAIPAARTEPLIDGCSEKVSALRVEVSPDAGRFYVAARSVQAGESLLEVEPDASVVDESFLTRVCAWCLKESKKGSLPVCCSGCQCVSYCSKECEASGASAHAWECVALERLRKSRARLGRGEVTKVRLALQILYCRHRKSLLEVADPIQTLHSGLEAFQQEREWKRRQKGYKMLMTPLAAACGYDFHWLAEEVEAVLGAIECNCFGMWDHSRSRCLGLSISDTAQAIRMRVYLWLGADDKVPASLFNHSCSPNVVRVRHGRRSVFRALRDIEEGEPLCISYIDPRAGTSNRQEELQYNYGFVCTCARCEGSADLPPMCHKHLGYLIKTKSGDTWCSACDR